MFRIHSNRFVPCMIVAVATSVTSSTLAAPLPTWPNACGDGRVDVVIDDFETVSAWKLCCSDGDLPVVHLEEALGCSGGALGADYRPQWRGLVRDLALFQSCPQH